MEVFDAEINSGEDASCEFHHDMQGVLPSSSLRCSEYRFKAGCQPFDMDVSRGREEEITEKKRRKTPKVQQILNLAPPSLTQQGRRQTNWSAYIRRIGRLGRRGPRLGWRYTTVVCPRLPSKKEEARATGLLTVTCEKQILGTMKKKISVRFAVAKRRRKRQILQSCSTGSR